MDSLRDQLAKLFPKLGKEDEVQPQRPPARETQHVPVKASLNASQDWKDGVTPLRSYGRKENVSTKVVQKDPIVIRRPAPAATSKVLTPTSTPTPTPTPTPTASPRATTVAKVTQPTVRQSQFGGLRQPALSRDAEFKYPDTWVSAGAALQPPQGGNGPVLPIRMGIDFGTAYTKVALRVGSASGQVFFVPWSGIRNHDAAHYLPGEISISPDGVVWPGRTPDAAEVRNDLKLPFIDRDISSREQFGAAIAFLAWVMRYSRAWLYETQSSLLRGRKLVWTVNLGCPTDSWAARDMRFSYEAMGTFAWELSQTPRDIGWEYSVSMAGLGKPSLGNIGLDGLHLMPEFIAQIYGYVKSPQRRDGLHLLMDVGAGTVDLATFNIGPDQQAEGDQYNIFASKVMPLGTHYLMADRIKSIASPLNWDDFRPVLSAKEFASAAKTTDAKIIAADNSFEQRVRDPILQLLTHTHTNRYGKAPEWNEGLPAFLSGGGAGCDVYADALTAAFQTHGVPLKRTPFPLLEEVSRLQGVGSKSFHRLSVAYGLTFDAESVGRILAPHEIEDAPRFDPNVDVPKERPDRDELYPK